MSAWWAGDRHISRRLAQTLINSIRTRLKFNCRIEPRDQVFIVRGHSQLQPWLLSFSVVETNPNTTHQEFKIRWRNKYNQFNKMSNSAGLKCRLQTFNASSKRAPKLNRTGKRFINAFYPFIRSLPWSIFWSYQIGYQINTQRLCLATHHTQTSKSAVPWWRRMAPCFLVSGVVTTTRQGWRQ